MLRLALLLIGLLALTSPLPAQAQSSLIPGGQVGLTQRPAAAAATRPQALTRTGAPSRRLQQARPGTSVAAALTARRPSTR